MAPRTISIIGGLDADLIMITNRFPDRGESVLANEYLEALGGKGANSAISTYRSSHESPLQREEAIEIREMNEKPPWVLSEAATDYKDETNIQVKMIGAVGDDRYGERFIAKLTKNGIDTSGIVTVPNTPSSICFVMVDHFTRENSCLFTPGATATWKKEDFMQVEDLGSGMRPDLVVA